MEDLNLISDDERERLLSELHRLLVWVGEPLPETMKVNGENVEIHEIVWSCIQKGISDQEKERLANLIRSLEVKEEYDEETLKNANLTREEAERLYHESASLIRAIMDLKTCEADKFRLKEPKCEMKQKIEDTKRWLNFLKTVSKK